MKTLWMELSEYEEIIPYVWLELQGLEVTIGVVQREDEDGEPQTELIARAKDGTIYFLPFSYYDQDEDGSFKCKPKSAANNLLKLMQPAPASPSQS